MCLFCISTLEIPRKISVEIRKINFDKQHIANIERSKERTPAYIGKPLTQEEIDEKKKNGRNASGLTPLSNIIPAAHWQELEARAATNGNGGHYDRTTKNAPVSIDATMEQLTKVLHDEQENTAQNINRAAKLCRESEYSPEQFTDLLWSVYHEEVKHIPDKLVKKKRADGLPNKMLIFFSKLEERLGVKKSVRAD